MTPETTARLVARWVRIYTRNLPGPVARRRIEEIDADLHDHIAHERARGAGDRRIALGIASRMVRGMAADASWRGRHARVAARSRSEEDAMTTNAVARRSTVRVAAGAASILLLPLVAMLITDQVAWGVFDFVLAGLLLVGVGLALERVVRRTGHLAHRLAVGLSAATAVALVWVVSAVGLVAETGDRVDLLYGAVLAIGVAGAVLTRARPAGMAHVLLAMALAQAVVAAIALAAGRHRDPVSSMAEILGVNAIFIALFACSAWLFQRAARRSAPAPAAPRR